MFDDRRHKTTRSQERSELLSDYEKCINVPFSEIVVHEKDFEVRVRQTSDQELVKVIIRIDTKRLTYVCNTTRC